jgi:hypothetical protein
MVKKPNHVRIKDTKLWVNGDLRQISEFFLLGFLWIQELNSKDLWFFGFFLLPRSIIPKVWSWIRALGWETSASSARTRQLDGRSRPPRARRPRRPDGGRAQRPEVGDGPAVFLSFAVEDGTERGRDGTFSFLRLNGLMDSDRRYVVSGGPARTWFPFENRNEHSSLLF